MDCKLKSLLNQLKNAFLNVLAFVITLLKMIYKNLQFYIELPVWSSVINILKLQTFVNSN